MLTEIETIRHTQSLYRDALTKFEAQVSLEARFRKKKIPRNNFMFFNFSA